MKIDKKKFIFTVILYFIGLTGCSTPEQIQKNDDQKFAQEVMDEITVGRLMAAKLAGHLGYDDSDPSLITYLNLVGSAVATQGNRPEIVFHFGILKSQEINAFATPGGYIFLTRPLLNELKSESELAGVLGHEIAHVTEKHMYKEIAPKRTVSTGEMITRILSRGGSDLGFSLGKIVNSGLEILLETGLGEEKEISADQAGSLLAYSVGYDPQALLNFLIRLENHSSTVKLSKTHPPFPKRLQDLRSFLLKNGFILNSFLEPPERQSRFDQALKLLNSTGNSK